MHTTPYFSYIFHLKLLLHLSFLWISFCSFLAKARFYSLLSRLSTVATEIFKFIFILPGAHTRFCFSAFFHFPKSVNKMQKKKTKKKVTGSNFWFTYFDFLVKNIKIIISFEKVLCHWSKVPYRNTNNNLWLILSSISNSYKNTKKKTNLT